MDLALLVSLQGDMIDNIEANVRSAKESVLHAEDDLILSKNNLSGARKVFYNVFSLLNDLELESIRTIEDVFVL